MPYAVPTTTETHEVTAPTLEELAAAIDFPVIKGQALAVITITTPDYMGDNRWHCLALYVVPA